MKQSNYFISAEIDKVVLYYNLVNDTLLELPANKKKGCAKCLQNPNDSTSIYWRKLYEERFIVEDNYDELSEIRRRHLRTVNSADEWNITVVCTLKCNSDCVYCYQRNLDFKYPEMTETDFQGLYEFLVKLPQRNIHINWYGGEPLLVKERILEFCDKADRDKQHTYSHSISTNASIYDEKFYRKMERYGLTNITVSVVGTGQTHDGLRASAEYGAENVFRNIVYMTRHTDVVVNINLCKTNIKNVKEIFGELSGYKRSSIFFTFSRIVSYEHRPCADIELDADTYIRHVLELSNWALDNQFRIGDMSCFQNFGIYCGAYAKQNYVVGPGLYLYQCDRFYDPDNAFAQIADGTIKYTGSQNSGICENPYENEECKNCKILPYCNGGCDYLRKLGKSACPAEKNYLEEYLKLYYRIFFARKR